MDILLIKMVISILYLYILHTNTTSNVKKYSMQDIAILLQNIFASCLLQVFFYYFFIVLLCFVFDCSFFFLFFCCKICLQQFIFFAVYLCKYDIIILFTLE